MEIKKIFKTGRATTPKDCINEAYRYYNNAKEILKNIPIEYNAYKDVKKLQKACAIGYLAVLYAIDGFLLSKGIPREKLPTSIDDYWNMLEKYSQKNGKVITELTIVYQNLHVFGYYRGAIDVEMIKSGFKNAKNLIDHFAKFIKK